MVRHLCAFYQKTHGITDEEITVVPDGILTQDGNKRFMIPPTLNKLEWVYASAANIQKARIYCPSAERKRTKLYIRKLNADLGSIIGDEPRDFTHRDYTFDPTEHFSMRFTVGGTADEDVIGAVQIYDGTEPPVPGGEPILVRATASVTLTPFEWTLVNITPDEQLEAGNYALIGFVPISDNLICARVIITGQVYRPGVLGFRGSEVNALKTLRRDFFEKHLYGVFDHKSLPQFEFLSAGADTSQVVYMLLIKTA